MTKFSRYYQQQCKAGKAVYANFTMTGHTNIRVINIGSKWITTLSGHKLEASKCLSFHE